MKFGVYLNTQAPPDGVALRRVYDELFETATLAESLGFDACFLPEHHQRNDGYLPAPYAMAAAVAARTSRIRIHTGTSVLPLWHPLRVAEDVAVISVLSGGRFALGVSLGLVEEEYRQFEIDLRTAPSRFEEQIEILKRAWTSDSFSFHGRHFNIADVRLRPRPFAGIRPDIWIGGMSDRSIERAGRIGDGWLTDPLHSVATIAGWAESYRRAATARGAEGRIWLQRDCWVAASTREVDTEWAPHLVADWRANLSFGSFTSGRFNPRAEPWLASLASPDEVTFERMRGDRVIAGTPDEVVSALEATIRAVHPEGIAFRFRFPHGPDNDTTLRALRLFGREVLPHFRAV